MTTISPTRLDALDLIRLDAGHHATFADGHCALEVAAWLADEPHTDRPSCVARVLADYVRRLNDAMLDSERERLRPYLPRIVGTGRPLDADERRYRMVSTPDARGARRWIDALDEPLGETFPALVGEIDAAHLIAASAWITSHVRPIGAASTIEARLAPSAIGDAVAQRIEHARDVGEQHVSASVATRRLVRRIEREDEFAAYRDLRSGAIDDLLGLLDVLIEG